MELLLTIILGIFIIIGAVIVFLFKNNEKITLFSISLAFGVMVMLVIFNLIPEAFEIIESDNLLLDLLYIIIGIFIGFMLLKGLDCFIPDHHDDLDTHEDDDDNFKHIGLVSSIALVIHNIVEGMAIYLLVMTDLKHGLLASIGIGLHNIPLGMVIASTFYKANKSKKNTMLIILGISLSTFVGGLIIYIFNLSSISEIFEAIIILLTTGMLIYISVMELLPKLIHSKNKKVTLSGVCLGIILIVLTLFVHRH